MTNDWLAVIVGMGLIAYTLLGFLTSAVIAATTRTSYVHHYKDDRNADGMRQWISTSRHASGWFAVFCGSVWPGTLVLVAATWSVKFAGRRLRPGRQWNRLVHKMNPGADVRW